MHLCKCWYQSKDSPSAIFFFFFFLYVFLQLLSLNYSMVRLLLPKYGLSASMSTCVVEGPLHRVQYHDTLTNTHQYWRWLTIHIAQLLWFVILHFQNIFSNNFTNKVILYADVIVGIHVIKELRKCSSRNGKLVLPNVGHLKKKLSEPVVKRLP